MGKSRAWLTQSRVGILALPPLGLRLGCPLPSLSLLFCKTGEVTFLSHNYLLSIYCVPGPVPGIH